MNKTLNKTLIALGIVAAAAVPAAAFAHTDVSIGVGFAAPAYVAPPAVVYEQPAPAYAPPAVVYSYYGRYGYRY